MNRPVNVVKAAVSAVRLIRNPSRLAEVFTLADQLVLLASPERLATVVAETAKDATSARALHERPRLGTIDLQKLRLHAPGTLGREFAEHMISNALDPSALPNLPSTDEIQFFRAHLYETHDVWHVVTGFGTDLAGELGLQAFYVAQLPGGLAPALLAGGMLNTVFFAHDEKDVRMRAIVRGWLLGKRARPLFGTRWNQLWDKELSEVRALLGVDVAGVESALPSV